MTGCSEYDPACRIQPLERSSHIPVHHESTAHGAAYAVHAGLTYTAVLSGRAASRAMVYAVAASTLLGVVTEALQWVVPGRNPSLADAAADMVGATVGAVLGWRLVDRERFGLRDA